MRKNQKIARLPVVNPSEFEENASGLEPQVQEGEQEQELAPVASTRMTVETAVQNLTNVARSVQATFQSHELLSESIRVVRKHCGLPPA